MKNSRAVLKSKLEVYIVCYQEAKKCKDLKRMALLCPMIDNLQDELELLED